MPAFSGPCPQVTADGRRLLAGGTVCGSEPGNERTAELRLWDVETGRPVNRPLDQILPVWAVVFSPDGRGLLTGCESGEVGLWVAATGLPVGHVGRESGNMTAITFSPDGRTAATTCWDRRVRLWDVATGHQLGPPIPHPAAVTAASFHPDGRRLVTAGEDGLVRIWNLPAAVPGDVAVLRRWVEALTGVQMAEDGSMRELDPAAPARQQEALRRARPGRPRRRSGRPREPARHRPMELRAWVTSTNGTYNAASGEAVKG